MIELQLRYEGNGVFRVANRAALEVAAARAEQGQVYTARLTSPRSHEQNRYFHALVRDAYEQQRGGPVLPTWMHLRNWLLCEVGHCEVQAFQPGAITREVAAWLRGRYDDVHWSTDGRQIYARTPKSINVARCEQDRMNQIVTAVVDVICKQVVPGTTPEDWAPDERGHQERAGRHAAPRRPRWLAVEVEE